MSSCRSKKYMTGLESEHYDDTLFGPPLASTFKIPESGVNRRVSGEWRRGDHAGQTSASSKSMHFYGLFVQSLHRDSDLIVS
jgi:hypothetical protein